jgi:hypothetical protein
LNDAESHSDADESYDLDDSQLPLFHNDDDSDIIIDHDDETESIHSTETTSTAGNPVSSSRKSKKRRHSKVCKSPKKWRRMIRTKRLQSILLLSKN